MTLPLKKSSRQRRKNWMKKEFKPIKITVIGTVCWDKIIHPDGRSTESFGGIAYSILTLADLLESRAVIRPVCLIGHDRYQGVLNLFEQSPDIDLAGIRPVDHQDNAVIIIYSD